MTKPTERFSNRAHDYHQHRPSYPRAAIACLVEAWGLGAEHRVADIGSGTGIFTRQLLEAGLDVYAVEPNDAMRQAAEEGLGAEPRFHPRFHSVAGSAEATGLAAGSIDAVTVAQAFHWFDADAFQRECQRILRPPGRVALVWNRRDMSTPFGREYEAILQRFGTDYREVGHMRLDESDVFERFFAGGTFEVHSFPYAQQHDWEGLVGRVRSASYAPAPGDPHDEPMLAALRELFDRLQEGGSVRFDYETLVYLGCV
jgi:SAM-dependent methyltransferase